MVQFPQVSETAKFEDACAKSLVMPSLISPLKCIGLLLTLSN